MFQVVKQGDIYRILYSAKSFQTGLTDIQGIPYNPSGVAQTAITFSEIGSSGVYYHDFDTSSKALGSWAFKIDSASKSAPAYTRIQVVDGATLNDTAFENMVGKIDTVLTNQGTQSTALGNIYADTQAIKSDVQSGTYGLQQLKSSLDGITSVVSGIQNNVSVGISIPTEVIKPDTGSVTKRIKINIYDASGNMEDPDSNLVSLSVKDSAGNNVTSTFFPTVTDATRDALGVYYIDAVFASTINIDDYIFTVAYTENGQSKVHDRNVSVITSSADVTGTLATIETKIDGITTKTNTIDGRLTDGTNGLAAIKTQAVANYNELANPTYGLSQIKSGVDGNASALNTANLSLADVKGVGFDSSKDSLHEIRLMLSGGVAI